MPDVSGTCFPDSRVKTRIRQSFSSPFHSATLFRERRIFRCAFSTVFEDFIVSVVDVFGGSVYFRVRWNDPKGFTGASTLLSTANLKPAATISSMTEWQVSSEVVNRDRELSTLEYDSVDSGSLFNFTIRFLHL